MRAREAADRAAIVAVLEDDRRFAPPRPDAPGGATLALRDAMARFSPSRAHPARRSAIEGAIATIEVAHAADVAARLTAGRLGGPLVDVVPIASQVPVAALAACLDLDRDRPSGEIVGDVDAVASVIGRGRPPTTESDAAATRLLDLASDHPAGPVAVVSILHQCLDATAALILTSLHSRASGAGRTAAVPRTRRVATVRTRLPRGALVEAGDDVTLEVGAAGLEFGAGPHRCPGQELAEVLARSVAVAIEAAGYSVALHDLRLDADGRPAVLTIRR